MSLVVSGRSPQTAAAPDLSGIRAELTRLSGEGAHSALIALVMGLLEKMAQDNSRLAIRLQGALRQLYRKKSERISPEQLALFLSVLGQEDATAAAGPTSVGAVDPGIAAAPAATAAPDACVPVKPFKRPKRKPFPDNLRREVKMVPVPEADRTCEECGGAKESMGYDIREMWEFKPAEFFLLEQHLEKCVCKKCQEGVVAAEGMSKPIEGGRPGPGLLAQLATSKVRDSCPLYRQAKIYRQSGIELSPSTLGEWFAATADMLEPLWKAARQETLVSWLLSLDDTRLSVLDGDHPNGVKRGHIWTYLGDYNRIGFCAYTPSWAGDAPRAVLEEFKGKCIQADGYAGIDAFFEKPSPPIRAGCMDHCRRKFLAALEAGHMRAAAVMALMQELYAVEAKARADGLGPEALLQRRKEISTPLMDRLKALIAEMHLAALPKGALGKATTYAINQWDTLCAFLGDARIPLSNAHVERQQRGTALGRKNYLFAGSDEGARRLAIIQTFVVLCDLSDVPMFEYLRDVLGKLADGWLMSRLRELLPAAWAADQKAKKLDAQAA